MPKQIKNHNAVTLLLSSHAGELVTDDQIRLSIWPDAPHLVTSNHLRQVVFIAKKKLCHGTVVRVRGCGYKYLEGVNDGRK